MTNDELNKYILHYLEHDKTHSAIMLTAPWGTGKSYYIQNELKPFLEKEENGKHKCIVVSLYGLKDLFEVSKALYLECRMKFLNGSSEKAVTGKFAAKTVLKGITSFFGIDLSKTEEEMKALYNSVDLSRKLIVLEDLERSGISIIEILGYVNNLVEQDGVKVLLVANENEIIKKEKKAEKDESGTETEILVNSNETEQYLRTKEKTVSDTIKFHTEFETPVETIIRSFNEKNGDKLNLMLERKNSSGECELVQTIINIMSSVKSFNLRAVIFGCQKTVNLLQYTDDSYDIHFLEYLLCSNIAFALRLKENDDLKWEEEDEKSSSRLGTYTFPLLKVAFDYIKYQYCDSDELKKANDTYCRQKGYENSKKAIKKQVDVIYRFRESWEREVSSALAEVTNNLESSEDIPCGEFGKLSSYLVAIHKTMGHDEEIKRCRTAMVKRIEKCGSDTLEDDLRFTGRLQMNLHEENDELTEWTNEMLDACKVYQQAKITFDYHPDNAEKFENEVIKNRNKYENNHVFAKKLDVKNLVNMISASSPSQIASIKRAFSYVYSFSNLNDFFEDDKETLEKLKSEIDKLIEMKKGGDKMVLLQLQDFSEDLKSFVDKI